MANEGAASIRARTAPAADHPVKPGSPTDLGARAWRRTLRAAAGQFQRHQCTDLAAALTYYSVLSVFPALLALLSLLGVFGQGRQTVDTLLDIVRGLGQADVAEQLRGPIEAMVGGRGAGITLVIGVVTALFSASAYVGGFGRALNRIYEIDEGRPVWKLRPLMFAVTLGLVVLAGLVLVGLVVSGSVAQQVGDLLGAGQLSRTVWSIAKWPVMLAIVMVIVAVLYHVTPNVRQPRIRWLSPGAVLAILTWVLASVAFGFYVGSFGRYDATYGSLGSVIVFLLWLWITNLALLLGAEVDAELERTRELEAGIPAERTIQLPPRDTTQSDKAREKLERRVASGRRLREEAARDRVSDLASGYVGTGGGRRWVRRGAGPVATLEPLPSEQARHGQVTDPSHMSTKQ
jgi:membrane protein